MELFSPKTEEKILEFWKRDGTFEKSLTFRQAQGKKFVFFEGPPSANGQPGIHHVLTRVYKDLICRYKTMRGFYVGRKAGWDTHGLPIEIQVEKELGLKNKKEIEKYGVGKFNRKAQETVWRYKEDWDKLTERIGFWLDLKNPYITYEPHYIESLWHIISKIWNKNLLYEDFKVVPYCTRCGTALSSHEVALGYQKISENSVYLKFKLKAGQKLDKQKIENDTYILSWTTTPWTLPGNVALAINKKIYYSAVSIKSSEETYILARELVKTIFKNQEIKIINNGIKGENLIGLEYEPLFEIPELKTKASYKIYPADFVTVEDGTGVVHTAVMYGPDDFNLGQKVGLPKYHTVDLNGKFVAGIGSGLDGLYVKSEEAELKILNHLKENGLLLKTAGYEHDYPFCWRCDSPLLYYAKTSWFIKMSRLKSKLIANNKKINWIPEHIKNGRFGGWLKEIKDWAFSRERYWGTPLPLWRCKKCDYEYVVGSLADLDKLSPRKLNKYIFLRHGEAENNAEKIISSFPEKKQYPLTIKGIKEIEKLIPWFKKKKVDLIFSSDIFRAKETAQIIAGALNKKIFYDKRLRETDFGIYNGRTHKDWHSLFSNKIEDQYNIRPEGGENLKDICRRIIDFIRSVDEKHEGKTILVVSHANPILAAAGAYQGYNERETFAIGKKFHIVELTGSILEISGHNWPYNDLGNLDLHRPHIDNLHLKCPKCHGMMKRTKDVVDVWFDSGAMPFAQYHWPFNKKLEYPADFISEAVDQTRGWFYTLHAVGALMNRGPAYKNVICLGHVLDENGDKMSKSKGNVINPWEVINRQGVDALRWYFYTINPPGEPKRFAIKDVDDKLKRFILTLSNVLIFYKTYASQISNFKFQISNLGILDRWILSRLNQMIKIVRKNLDSYEVTQSARLIDDFIDDLSRWWLRRSRRRFSGNDFETASFILKKVLEELSKIIAPFTPFLAEYLWHNIGNIESVHLQEYPKPQTKYIDLKLERQMAIIRGIAAKGLALRAEAGIKVRQPLQKLQITNKELNKNGELLDLIKEELNVKEITFGDELKLDTVITGKLKEEGIIRELARQIQEMRKDGGLTPKDYIALYFNIIDENLKMIINKRQKDLLTDVGAKKIEFTGAIKDGLLIDRHFKMNDRDIWIGIAKVRQ